MAATFVQGVLDLAAAIAADIKALGTSKADKTNVVDLLSAQAVDGTKTFSSPPAVLPLPTLSSNSQLTHKKYVDDLFATVGGASGTSVPANYIPIADRDVLNVGFSRRQTYVIPKEDLLNYSAGASNATKLAAFANNNAKVKTALQTYPNRLIELDGSTGEFWPLSLEADELSNPSQWGTPQAYRIKGRLKQAIGTFPDQATYDTYAANGSNPGGYVPAKPVIEVTRVWGTPQDISSISIATFGPGSPVPWYMQTQQATKINLTLGTDVQIWEQGDAGVVCSNNSYGYAIRAGYAGDNVWKAQRVNIADIGMDVVNYTLAAASSASVAAGGPPLIPNGSTSANGMEARVVRGGTSGVTALVRGDTGASQLLFTKLTTAFAAGEQLFDDATNTLIGTVGSIYLIVSGKLANAYTTTPCIRKVRRDLPVVMDLEVQLDGDPSSKISKWNRCPEVALNGTYDHNVKVNILSGSQRGVAITSCFRGLITVKGGKLPNNAMEQVNPKEEGYGYGAVVLGCSADLTFDLDVQDVRHGFSSNVLGGKWNLTSTGTSGTHAQSTNYHKYGTSRDIHVRGKIYYTFGACIDTHEGMDGLVVEHFRVGKSFWAGRNLSMGAGINSRGTNTIIRDGLIEQVKVGIFDSSQSTPIGETGFRSDMYIKDVIVLKAQAGGYMTNDDVASGQAITTARTFIDGCTLEGDLDVTTSTYTGAGVVMNRGWLMTRNLTIRKQNSAMIIHKGSTSTETPPSNGGVGIHLNPVFDFTEGSANTCVRYETNMSTAIVFNYTILENGALRPTYVFRHEVDTPATGIAPTVVQHAGGKMPVMTASPATPTLTFTKAGNTRPATVSYISDLGATLQAAGATLPAGGTAGQVLKKNTSTDGDASWVSISEVPAGGTTGQVLTKNSATDGDDGWSTLYGVPAGGSTGQMLRKSSTVDGDDAWAWPAQYTNVNIDGVKQLTLDISSEPPIRYLVVPPAGESWTAAINTVATVPSLQTTFSVGTYYIRALLFYQVPAAAAVRFGFGGAGAAGASIDNLSIAHSTSENTTNGRNNVVVNTIGVIGAAAAAGTVPRNLGGNSTTVLATNLPVEIEGRVVVTTAGTLGIVWTASVAQANKITSGLLKIERIT